MTPEEMRNFTKQTVKALLVKANFLRGGVDKNVRHFFFFDLYMRLIEHRIDATTSHTLPLWHYVNHSITATIVSP
jgi:hypothetical protein